MAAILQTTFSNAFSFQNQCTCILIQISPKFVPKGPINVSISLDDGLALNRLQTIIWTSDGIVYWQKCASLSLNILVNYALDWGTFYLQLPIFNPLRPRQNGRHFADDTFNRIFVNENIGIFIKFSLKFVPKGPINNIPTLVQIMAWRPPGNKPLSEPMMTKFNDAYMRHSASVS